MPNLVERYSNVNHSTYNPLYLSPVEEVEHLNDILKREIKRIHCLGEEDRIYNITVNDLQFSSISMSINMDYSVCYIGGS